MLKFLGNMKPEFANSVSTILRTQKDKYKKDVEFISIPSHKLFNREYIALLFIQHGRIAVKIDTTTFRNRVMVECEDGEVWSARLNLAEAGSVFVMQLPTRDQQKLESDMV